MEALLLQANANAWSDGSTPPFSTHARECVVSAASSFLQIFADFLKERRTLRVLKRERRNDSDSLTPHSSLQADVFLCSLLISFGHWSLASLVGLPALPYHRRRLVIGARCGLFNTYN